MSDITDSFVASWKDVASVQECINRRYNESFIWNQDGSFQPYVCSFCDEFLLHEHDQSYVNLDTVKKKWKLLAWCEHVDRLDRIPALESAFRFLDEKNLFKDNDLLMKLALSPRGIIGKKRHARGCRWGFSSCNTCKWAITNGYTPFHAIVNQNFVGNAPECIKELTEVERSIVTPVAGVGYCHTYTGGKTMNLKGTFTYFRVEERRIAKAVAQLERMGLTKHVVVVLTGKMTRRQKLKAQKKHTIRTDKIIAAVEWLVQNHRSWRKVSLDGIREQLKTVNPIVIDNSEEVESENANVEDQELFSCFFPDRSTNNKAGGFDEPGAFQEFVEEMQRQNFDMEVRLQLGSELLRGNDGTDELVMANLLQFPYGIGGLHERRIKQDGSGSYTDKVNAESFLSHLSLISQPEFQTPLFQLVMYTHVSRYRLLNRSRLQLREKRSASALASGVNVNDIRRAVTGRQRGDKNAGSYASRQLLKSVDAISKALPHTNEASSLARANAESLQHYFGIGTIWLTVNFDDENSFLLQVLSGRHVDDDTPLDQFTDDELHERYIQRRNIRLHLPGLSAMNFEVLIHIVFEEVLGWDMRRNCATGKAGLFGFCIAVCMALEEQGRKTIHGHITAWIRFFDQIRKLFFFGQRAEKQLCNTIIKKYMEHVSTTSLFASLASTDLKSVLNHECTVAHKFRQLPEVVAEQTLRDLRHRLGFDFHSGRFAYCKQCDKTWTYEKMVEKVIRQRGNICGMHKEDDEDNYELPKSRMSTHIVQFQMKRTVDPVNDTPVLCINAHYQHHVSCHVSGCFKCIQKGKKHVCGTGAACECRMRIPDLSRQYATIKDLSSKTDGNGVAWFRWDGSLVNQPILQILPKRGPYDLFQNVSCRAISESKLSCNTNVNLITDGPISQYNIKYQNKDTRKDDTKEYKAVLESIKRVQGRVHDDDRKEALRLIVRAAFAHNKENVIGAPFASYLIRHDSRFYFSHKFQHCPLKDIIRLLMNEKVDGVLQYTPQGDSYFENQALHYLCRPLEIEDCSVKTFFEWYQVKYLTKKRKRDGEDEILPLLASTEYFEHPSVDENGESRQGVEHMDEMKLVKIAQWQFPDTAKFRCNIFTARLQDMTRDMEHYALLVLVLFYPFRGIDDLYPDDDVQFPFVHKLQDIYVEEESNGKYVVFTPKNREFLQNIQNAAYNSMRYKVGDDDLKSRTVPFQTDDMRDLNDAHNDDTNEDEENNEPYEVLLESLDDSENDTTDDDPMYLPQHLSDFSFIEIRNEGTKKCGYDKSIPTPPVATNLSDWISGVPIRDNQQQNSSQSQPPQHRKKIKDIVKLLISKKTAKKRADIFTRNPDAEVCEADGTISSIADWANAAGMDEIQKRAFECIISSFLLTFIDDAEEEDDNADTSTSHGFRAKFRRHKAHLLKLKGDKNSQMILLLHGPGGSGKSTVINLVVDYAKEFCNLIGHRFTSRTIVITAMSGVAATLLHGETTHSALGLNRKTVADNEEMIEAWSDARLIIIDECSFATEKEFNGIYRNLGDLMQDPFHPYGGRNLVFAGDYSQLEPPGKGREPIYKHSSDGSASFNSQLTTFIELDGKHRFNGDPEWGERLLRFRNGEPTIDDIRYINKHCVISDTHIPPPKVQIATFRNKDRDAVNCAIFEQYCDTHAPKDGSLWDGAMLVLMDDVCMENSSRQYVSVQSNNVLKKFWTTIGEAGASSDMKRVDPCLKLYPGCPMMFTENKSVTNGQANGSRVNLLKVNVKPGEQYIPIKLECGAIIRGYKANQISSFRVKHEVADMCPQEFEIESKTFKFRTKFDTHGDLMNVKMSGTQFPIISNSCTTGHKLQGVTVEALLVNNWEYKQNWAYVVLSRVKTMSGLYLRVPLSEDLDNYTMPKLMKDMIAKLNQSISIQMLEEKDYATMISMEKTWFEES